VKFFLLLLFCTVFQLAALGQDATQQLLTDAQRNYFRGDLEAAKTGFQQVLAIDPRNEAALRYLRMIQAQEKKTGGGGAVQKQLRELTIARVEFRQATLDSALEYLKQEAARNNVQASFVVKPDVNQMQKITLSLGNVPFTEVLRYIGDLAKVNFNVERHAIVVSKRGAPSPSPEPAETPQVQ
jgi:hypothetical protein